MVEGTIEYKDIGIILTVTPRISDGGLVTLEISIEDSTVNQSAIPLGALSERSCFWKENSQDHPVCLRRANHCDRRFD